MKPSITSARLRSCASALVLPCTAVALALQLNQQNLLDEDAGTPPTPFFRKDTMPAVPTTAVVIINLSIQYFLIYAAMAVIRTWNELGKATSSSFTLQALIRSATATVNFCPMLCVLFLGARLRAEQITQGKTEELGLPNAETRLGMQVAANCVLGQLLCVLLLPLLTGGMSAVPTDSDGNVDLSKMTGLTNRPLRYFITLLRYFFMVGLYGGSSVVVYGINTMDIENKVLRAQMWPAGVPTVSPPVIATIYLTTVFFVVYTLLALVRTWLSFSTGEQPIAEKLGGALSLVSITVMNMAPMLCILFVGARMRALQIDPIGGKLPEYAQFACFGCTSAIVVQAVLIILLPFTSSTVRCERGDFEGDIKFSGFSGGSTLARIVQAVFLTLRYAALICVYGGFSAVCYAVYTMPGSTVGPALFSSTTAGSSAALAGSSPTGTETTTETTGEEETGSLPSMMLVQMQKSTHQVPSIIPASPPPAAPPLSPALLCVMNLAVQYFVIYLLMLVVQSLRQCMPTSSKLSLLAQAIDSSCTTVQYAPMLAVLFIAVRMRALQLAGSEDGSIPPRAGPPTYAQECMYLATWAVLVQVVTVFVATAMFPVEVDMEGNVKAPANAPKATTYVLTGLKYISMIAMHGGSVGIVYAMVFMTPETIQPYAHNPILPASIGIEVPKPVSPETLIATTTAAPVGSGGVVGPTTAMGSAPSFLALSL
ncbi:unnamed protein product [Amoebophrya sp. A25]|nr:unnamed protein product [Amoebophrya sp. A25]|eukprot:GSA25T00003454001.1